MAGDNNSRVQVKTYNVDSRVTKVMDLPIGEKDYVPSMEYGGTPDRLMVMILNRDQNDLKLYSVNLPRHGLVPPHTRWWIIWPTAL